MVERKEKATDDEVKRSLEFRLLRLNCDMDYTLCESGCNENLQVCPLLFVGNF